MSDLASLRVEILIMSREELNQVTGWIKERSRELYRSEAIRAACRLAVGQRVKFTHGGTTRAGILTKINATKGLVKISSINDSHGGDILTELLNGPVYRVPLAWLEVL